MRKSCVQCRSFRGVRFGEASNPGLPKPPRRRRGPFRVGSETEAVPQLCRSDHPDGEPLLPGSADSMSTLPASILALREAGVERPDRTCLAGKCRGVFCWQSVDRVRQSDPDLQLTCGLQCWWSVHMTRSVVGHWQEKLQTHCHEFKCHATDAMVADGRVRRDDKEGHDAADIAPDFGGLRQPEMVIDVHRNLLCLKKEWYSRVLVLHRLMVAVAREALVVDPLVWGRGSKPKVRRACCGNGRYACSSWFFWDSSWTPWILGLSLVRILVPGPSLSLCW